jgi:hypothetical protein
MCNKLSYTVVNVWSFCKNCIMMNGTMKVKFMLHTAFALLSNKTDYNIFLQEFFDSKIKNRYQQNIYLVFNTTFRGLNSCICTGISTYLYEAP